MHSWISCSYTLVIYQQSLCVSTYQFHISYTCRNKETVNKVNGFAWTALFYAIEREDKLMLEFLLKNGAGTVGYVIKMISYYNYYHT